MATFALGPTRPRRRKPAAYQNGTGNGFASLLLGAGNDAESRVPSHQPRWISNYWAGFMQDDLKVTKKPCA